MDFVAITDHNEISFAKSLKKEFGEKIIIGEEIKSFDGEIIGLFLQKRIEPNMSSAKTIDEIHMQGGISYIPHPFEKSRSGMQKRDLEKLVSEIDIIESFNARGIFRGKPGMANEFAKRYNIATVSSSDAHCIFGVGSAFTIVNAFPDEKNIKNLLKKGLFQKKYAVWYSLLCPFFNKIKNKIILGV